MYLILNIFTQVVYLKAKTIAIENPLSPSYEISPSFQRVTSSFKRKFQSHRDKCITRTGTPGNNRG